MDAKIEAALRAGLVEAQSLYPDDVVKMVAANPAAVAKLTVNEWGAVHGVGDVVNDLKEAKGYLFPPPAPPSALSMSLEDYQRARRAYVMGGAFRAAGVTMSSTAKAPPAGAPEPKSALNMDSATYAQARREIARGRGNRFVDSGGGPNWQAGERARQRAREASPQRWGPRER